MRHSVGIEEHPVGGLAGFDGGDWSIDQAARRAGETFHQRLPVKQSGADEVLVKRRQCRFQAGHAKGGIREFAFLFKFRKGRVVRGNHIDHSREEALLQSQRVTGRPQRGFDFEIGIVFPDIRFREDQVMRSHASRHGHAFLFVAGQRLHSACGGEMVNVDAGIHRLRQTDVPDQTDFLAACVHARQTQTIRCPPVVHGSGVGEFRCVAMRRHQHAEAPRVLEGAAHELGICDGIGIVGNHHRTPHLHVADLRQVLTTATLADASGDMEIQFGGNLRGHIQHTLDHASVIDGGLRVRHHHQTGDATSHGRLRARFQGFRVLMPRLAQMGVQVEETRQHHHFRGVDDPGSGRGHQMGADRADHSILHQDIASLQCSRGPDDLGGLDEQGRRLVRHCCLSLIPARRASPTQGRLNTTGGALPANHSATAIRRFPSACSE